MIKHVLQILYAKYFGVCVELMVFVNLEQSFSRSVGLDFLNLFFLMVCVLKSLDDECWIRTVLNKLLEAC